MPVSPSDHPTRHADSPFPAVRKAKATDAVNHSIPENPTDSQGHLAHVYTFCENIDTMICISTHIRIIPSVLPSLQFYQLGLGLTLMVTLTPTLAVSLTLALSLLTRPPMFRNPVSSIVYSQRNVRS